MTAGMFVHFRVDGDTLAVSLGEIREVARVSRVTPVPRAPAMLRGVANIRGRIVTLIDLDVLYAREPSAAPRGGVGHAVVLAAPRENLALFTRSRVDIGRGEETEVAGAPPPEAASRASGDLSRPPLGALLKFRGELVHLLPTAELAAHCEARVLERFRQRP